MRRRNAGRDRPLSRPRAPWAELITWALVAIILLGGLLWVIID